MIEGMDINGVSRFDAHKKMLNKKRMLREVFDEIGLAKHFGHGLGHGLGILVHDTGRLGVGSKTILEPGQVWTVEPGVYLEGWGGCRIEDNVVVTETGVINLTGSTKELLELPLA
jgi:Xaa-Pro aminopeptidase